MIASKSTSFQEAKLETLASFDQLKEQAKEGHTPVYILYTGAVGSVVKPKTWGMRDVLSQPVIMGKSIALVPTPHERSLYILEYTTGDKLGEITNPPMDLLNELTGL